jgi:hypothetical protein
VNTRSRLQPLFGNRTPHEGFSLWTDRPRPGRVERLDPLFADPLQPLLNPVRNIEAAAALYAGTRFDMYESLVFQGVTNNLPGTRSTDGSNRFNVRMDTKLLEWEDGSHTQFTVQWRSSESFPSDARSLAFSVGSPDGLDAQRSAFQTRLTRLILAQGFLEDRLTVSVGKINPNDYMGLNLFASDETSQFLNTALDGNNVLPIGFQSYTEGAAFQLLPVNWLYVNGVLSSASGAQGAYFQDAFRKGWFGGIEAGLILHPFDRPMRLSASWGASNANDRTLRGGPTVYGMVPGGGGGCRCGLHQHQPGHGGHHHRQRVRTPRRRIRPGRRLEQASRRDAPHAGPGRVVLPTAGDRLAADHLRRAVHASSGGRATVRCRARRRNPCQVHVLVMGHNEKRCPAGAPFRRSGPDRARTDYLFHAMEALSQMSYRPSGL